MTIKLRKIEMIYLWYTFLVLPLMLFDVVPGYRISMYLLAITYVFIVALTLQYRNFSIYQMFLFTYFFFLLSRIFLTMLGLYDFRRLVGLRRIYMSEELTIRTLNVLTLFLIGTSYAWLCCRRRKKKVDQYFSQPTNKTVLNKLYKLAFFVLAILTIVKYALTIRILMNLGYIAYFNGDLANVGMPALLKYAPYALDLLFIIVTFYNRDRHTMLLYGGVFLAIGLFRILEGHRGYSLCVLLYFIYMWSTYYSELKFYNWKALLVVALVPLLIQFIAAYRNNDYQATDFIKENVYVETLEGQGVSLEVVADTIELNDQFTNKVPFLLGYFTDIFTTAMLPAGQNVEQIKHGNYLGAHLTYTLDPARYLSGYGTGTSIVAETYSTFGGMLFFTLVMGFLLTLPIFYFETHAYKNIYFHVLAFHVLKGFIYSPRDSYFKDLKLTLIELALCYFLVLLERSLIRKDKRQWGRSRSGAAYLMEKASPD